MKTSTSAKEDGIKTHKYLILVTYRKMRRKGSGNEDEEEKKLKTWKSKTSFILVQFPFLFSFQKEYSFLFLSIDEKDAVKRVDEHDRQWFSKMCTIMFLVFDT